MTRYGNHTGSFAPSSFHTTTATHNRSQSTTANRRKARQSRLAGKVGKDVGKTKKTAKGVVAVKELKSNRGRRKNFEKRPPPSPPSLLQNDRSSVDDDGFINGGGSSDGGDDIDDNHEGNVNAAATMERRFGPRRILRAKRPPAVSNGEGCGEGGGEGTSPSNFELVDNGNNDGNFVENFDSNYDTNYEGDHEKYEEAIAAARNALRRFQRTSNDFDDDGRFLRGDGRGIGIDNGIDTGTCRGVDEMEVGNNNDHCDDGKDDDDDDVDDEDNGDDGDDGTTLSEDFEMPPLLERDGCSTSNIEDSDASSTVERVGNPFAVLQDDEGSSLDNDNDSSRSANEDDPFRRLGDVFSILASDGDDDDDDHEDEGDVTNSGNSDNLGVTYLFEIPHSIQNVTPHSSDTNGSHSIPNDNNENENIARCAICFRDEIPVDTKNKNAKKTIKKHHHWRRLVTLPCCGTNGRERSSSTRFCAACILQMAAPKRSDRRNNYNDGNLGPFGFTLFGLDVWLDEEENNEYDFIARERREFPVRPFYYVENRPTKHRRFIECPRCRNILIVEIIKKEESEVDCDEDAGDDVGDNESASCDGSDCRPANRSNMRGRGTARTRGSRVTRRTRHAPPSDWTTNPPSDKSIRLKCPSFMEKCKYIGRKRGMAKILWRAAFLHHEYIHLEALGGDAASTTTTMSDDILKLVRLGIFEKATGRWSWWNRWNKDVYRMNRANHTQLVEFFVRSRNTSPSSPFPDAAKERELCLELTVFLLASSLRHFFRLRWHHTLRMMDRFGFMALYVTGYLPPPPNYVVQEWVVTGLNVFCLGMVLQLLLILSVYCGIMLGVVSLVCLMLRCVSSGSSTISFRIGTMSATECELLLAVGLYLLYIFVEYVYNSPNLSWRDLVFPKTFGFVKEIVWG